MRIASVLAISCALLLSSEVRAANPAMTPEQQALVKKYRDIAQSLHPQFGDVHLQTADATLHLGKAYYYLPPDQSKRVLVDAWNNPPSAIVGIAGMIFPAGTSFLDEKGWAAVITYSPEGYVADTDAKSTDYGAMLTSAQEGEADENEQRKSQGMVPVRLKGWAQPPYYDAVHHTLVWARDIEFGSQTDDTLNYDLRALGRRGVLSMNIVATMSELGSVRTAAGGLQNIASFDTGSRYVDYKEGEDKKAEYGIAGLVAAGIGLAAAQKFGLLAIGLLFLKKFFVVVLAAMGGGFAWLRRVFAGRKEAQTAPPIEPAA